MNADKGDMRRAPSRTEGQATEFDAGAPEINQQAEWFSRGTKVVDALGGVLIAERFGNFEFDQNVVLDQ